MNILIELLLYLAIFLIVIYTLVLIAGIICIIKDLFF